MTFDQWLTEYYPVPAIELKDATDDECVQHCIKKWEGAKQENLPDGMLYIDNQICADVCDTGFLFGRNTCALCMKYPYDCQRDSVKCPIVRMQGVDCCTDNFNGVNVYEISHDNPSPMIDLLQRTLEFVKKGG